MFDAVLVAHDDTLDALEILDAIHTGTSPTQPVIVIGRVGVEQMEPYCLEAGADSYVSISAATTRGLIWRLGRAVQRHQLITENQRLGQQRDKQAHAEKVEAERMLAQQRSLVELIQQRSGSQAVPWTPPERLVGHYSELLKTSVVMGWGHMGDEVSHFSQVLTSAGVSGNQFVQLHVIAVESLVAELGSRGAKHVLNRADLLAMEVLLHLCESYRLGILESLGASVPRDRT